MIPIHAPIGEDQYVDTTDCTCKNCSEDGTKTRDTSTTCKCKNWSDPFCSSVNANCQCDACSGAHRIIGTGVGVQAGCICDFNNGFVEEEGVCVCDSSKYLISDGNENEAEAACICSRDDFLPGSNSNGKYCACDITTLANCNTDIADINTTLSFISLPCY